MYFVIRKYQCAMDPEEIQIKGLVKYDTEVILLEKSVDSLMCAAW